MKKQKLILINYSSKSLAIIGDTKPHKNKLKAINAKYNPNLKDEEGERFKGWIISKRREEEAKELINNL